MSSIEPIDLDAATGKAKALLDEYTTRGGGEPGPMVLAMANAPVLLRAYLDLNRAMKRTHLDRRIVERINLAVHEHLGCEYCLVAHTRAARQLGLTDEDIELARQGTATDPAIAAMVAFARQVLVAPRDVTDAQVDELRSHGYDDEAISEVPGLVSLQLLTGGLNLVAGIEPAPEALTELTSRTRRAARESEGMRSADSGERRLDA
jgi:AhpD family alkylhydroperoxidase